jgi:glucosylceramidase
MKYPYLFALVALFGAFGASAVGQESVQVYQTAKDTGDRLSHLAAVPLRPRGPLVETQNYVFVDPAQTYQTIIGIGGALTDAAAETFFRLPEATRRELIGDYYDARDGIGYTFGRTSINSCDFSSASYNYVQDGDTALATFSVEHDRRYRIPLIKAALAAAGGQLKLFASPWSPPAWMKDNGDMLHGGTIKPEYRDCWARYYVAFIRAYEKEGIPIWGLTVQNEPLAIQTFESHHLTAEQERDFVRDYLGPTLVRSGLGDKKLMIWDHNRTFLYERARVILADPEAAKYVWGIGYHWYSDPAFDHVGQVHAAFPKVHLLLTEACNGPFDAAQVSDWKWGERYGQAMIEDFNQGAEAWTDWNILLDEHGGPNHVGNFCFAPVHADTQTGRLTFQNSFYYIGQFSKFVRPGARRIVSSSTIDALQTTAFVDPDGTIAVVVMNATDAPETYQLTLGASAASIASPPHSIATILRPPP